ncbi:(2Fe-2S)-binding protein [Clostridia bacterium]|nr:(2Fe-2S)-binding protein [Clostridia bacterium]
MHPIVDFEEDRLVEVTVNGKKMMAAKDKPIAAALFKAGVDVFRITEKLKSPRSLFCGIGQCNDCVMEVNGIPNVRTCVTMVEEGMVINTQEGLGKIGELE